jgi:hypothetical protein
VKEVLTTNLKLSDEELQKFKELWYEAMSNPNYHHISVPVLGYPDEAFLKSGTPIFDSMPNCRCTSNKKIRPLYRLIRLGG